MTLAVLSLMVLAQTPAAPVAAYPAEGAPRDIFTPVSVSPATPDVTRAVFEFRRFDAGYDCNLTGACPAPRTVAPFNSHAPALASARWCFRARYENDAGTSSFSAERCFIEDRVAPLAPTVMDAGFSQGQFTLEYAVPEEADPDGSGVSRCCAGAVELDLGSDFSPYCITNASWTRAALSGGLVLPVPPGRWRPYVFCSDRAGNGSARGAASFEATLTPSGSAPPAPFWRLPDGGAAPDDLWINDTYLSRATFPGTATMRFSMVEHRVEDGGWDGVTILNSRNGSSSIFVRSDPPRKYVRYAVLDQAGFTSPFSAELRVRYDDVAPAGISGCVSTAVRDEVRFTFDGGLDLRTASSIWAQARTADGGALLFELDGGSVVLPEGAWTLSLLARDEAQNETAPAACPGVVVDVTGPACDAPSASVTGGEVMLSWQCIDALSAIVSYRLERDGAVLAPALGSAAFLDRPGVGSFTWRVRAVDSRGNEGPLSPPSVVVTLEPPPASMDAGTVIDAGTALADAGSTDGPPRRLGVGWSCSQIDGAWVALALVLFRRRVSRP